jgi:hypothetical protein
MDSMIGRDRTRKGRFIFEFKEKTKAEARNWGFTGPPLRDWVNPRMVGNEEIKDVRERARE